VKQSVVQLFVTCLVDSLFPSVGESTIAILEGQGLTVEFPFDQTCCGQPAFNAGFQKEAKSMARHIVEVLHDTQGPIISPSGSCAEMLTHHGPELLANDPDIAPKAREVASRVRELTAFLVNDLGITNVGARVEEQRAAYHSSCHGLRGLGIDDEPRQLLQQVEGLEFAELPEAETCCGFGGIFSIEMPEISTAMLDSKIENLMSTGADVLVGGDVGCLMHIEGGLRRRGIAIQVAHIATILRKGNG